MAVKCKVLGLFSFQGYIVVCTGINNNCELLSVGSKLQEEGDLLALGV